MKKLTKIFIEFLAKIVVYLFSLTKLTNYLLDKIILSTINRNVNVMHNGNTLNLQTPNSLCLWRSKTFSTKEPETLYWIDGFENQSVFWDIGANIGLYSIYAAINGHKIFSFEPSFLNLETLSKNINLNKLQNKITIFPIALNDTTKISNLNLSNIEWGGAHSTFDKKIGWDGKDLNTALSYRTLGFSIDDISKYLKMLPPDYIKVDVDGIENLVLSGGVNTIDKAKSVLIEITKNFQSQSLGVKNILENLDFQLINEFKTSEYSHNQIWNKKI